jgi:hypothetical protein
MPAPASSRQPGSSHWFSGHPGQVLLEDERDWLAPRLAVRPSQPCLWYAPVPMTGDVAGPTGRCLQLFPDGVGYGGSMRCGLPLALSSECVGDVVLQHPAAGEAADWLEEGARVLVEGGRLWLCVFNPLGPFRLRGNGASWRVPALSQWRGLMQRRGLQVRAMHVLGPAWRLRPGEGQARHAWSLRAACVFEAEKRVGSCVPPAPVQWRRGAAPAS